MTTTAAPPLPPADHGPLAEFGAAFVVLALLILALAIGKYVLVWILDGSDAQESTHG